MRRLGYGHVMVDGVKIQYYRTGENKPPVILLHGAMDNALCWNRFPLILEPVYDVVLMDARGHGFSGAPAAGYGPDEHAADVIGVIEQLELHHPILIGHSMGAETAAVVAAKSPGLIKALILEDPPWAPESFGVTETERKAHSEDLRHKILERRTMIVDDLMALGKSKHPSWDESEFFQWAKGRKQVKPQIAQGVLVDRKPWKEVIAEIACPGLLLVGDVALGGNVTPEMVAEVGHLWSNCQIVEISEAGHHIHREQYRAYQETTRRFLRSVRRL